MSKEITSFLKEQLENDKTSFQEIEKCFLEINKITRSPRIKKGNDKILLLLDKEIELKKLYIKYIEELQNNSIKYKETEEEINCLKKSKIFCKNSILLRYS